MTKTESEQEEILDRLRRDREAHERLLRHVENRHTRQNQPSDAKPLTPETEQRLRKISMFLAGPV
jgi:hypothetical protein